MAKRDGMPDKLLSADPRAGVVQHAADTADAKDSTTSGTNTAVSAALLAHLTPYLERGLMDFATNPNAAKVASGVAKGMNYLALPTAGAVSGGPVGATTGMLAAAKTAWPVGKAAYRSTQFMQGLAAPLTQFVEAISPYVQKLNPAIGAQGMLDLAQMVEPAREDIGVLGIGKTPSQPSNQASRQKQQQDDIRRLRTLVARGTTPQEAARIWANGNTARYAELMNLYLKAKQ